MPDEGAQSGDIDHGKAGRSFLRKMCPTWNPRIASRGKSTTMADCLWLLWLK